jgi:hypothetical protein
MTKIDDQTIRERFGLIWPAHVENLTQFLIQCRRHFRGDLDLFLVLCVVGDRTFSSARVPPDFTYDDFNDPVNHPIDPEGLNARSISDYSGIPRETVRRKIGDLIDLGWVVRDESGFLRATDKARLELAPLTECSFAYIIRMARVLERATS